MTNMTRTCIIALTILCAVSGVVHADQLSELLPELSASDIRELYAGELLEAQTLRGSIVHLAPADSLALDRTRKVEAFTDGFTINSLVYMPYPDSFAGMTLEERMLDVFNRMRAISTQEGITYISHRRGEVPHTLIRDSYYIADERGKRALPDPVAAELPAHSVEYVYQRDTSFGGNVYRHTYTIRDREIFLEVDNISTMRVMLILPVVRPEELNISMAAYFLDGGILLYALVTIAEREPVARFLGFEVHLPSAFRRRVTSLQEWFSDQLYQQ